MPQELQLPSASEAMGTLDQVYARVFFAKMAEYGHVPATEEDARSMLETALSLDGLPEPITKQGSAGAYVFANRSLQTKLAQDGLPNQTADVQQSWAAKQASLAFAQYPDVYKAVLAIKSAEEAEAETAD